MTELWQVLGWKFNNESGMSTYDGNLSVWPPSLGPWPTEQQLAQWTTEFDAAAALPTASEQRRSRIGEIIAIPRSDWTSAQWRELLQLTAQELTQ